MILTAGYILWTLQRVFLGRSEQYKGLPDLNLREWIIAVPLVVLTVALGVFPQSMLLSWMGPSVDQMVTLGRRRPRRARQRRAGQAGRRSCVDAGPPRRSPRPRSGDA